MFPGAAESLYRSTSLSTIRANCTDSEIVAVSLGYGRIGSPRSRIAATMQAANDKNAVLTRSACYQGIRLRERLFTPITAELGTADAVRVSIVLCSDTYELPPC
jgi:hypothetical protein